MPVRAVLISALVLGVYLLEDTFGRSFFRSMASDLEPGWLRTLANLGLYYVPWTFLIPLVVAAVVVGPRQMVDGLGLNGSVWTAVKIGLVATAVLPVVYAFIAPFTPDDFVRRFLNGSLFPGIGEEIFYRGMLFGILFRFAGWGFLPAALLGATIFGIGHFAQGNSLSDFLGIFGITGAAAIWWSWMYIEWENNIWVPAGLHILMNGYFAMFDVADGTLGSWTFFAIRVVVVLISVAMTVVYARRRGFFRIVGRDWIWRKLPLSWCR